MKKNRFLLSIIALFIFIIGQTACEKMIIQPENIKINTENVLDTIKLENGTLQFENKDQFINFVDVVSKSDPKTIENWENSIGYVSVNKLQEEALAEIKDDFTEEELIEWLEKYKNLFELVEDKNGEKEIKPIIEDYIYSILCNNKNYYFIGDNVNYVNKDELTILPKNKIGLLNSLNKNEFKDKFVTFKIKKNQNIKTDHPISHTAIAIRNERWCRNDRKVVITNSISHYYIYYSDYGYYYYKIEVNTKVKGFKKVACIWVSYKTDLNFNSVKGEVYYNNSNNYKGFQIPSRSGSDVNSITGYANIISGQTLSWDEVEDNLTGVYFKKDYGKATSRGVGNLWAIIDYNY